MLIQIFSILIAFISGYFFHNKFNFSKVSIQQPKTNRKRLKYSHQQINYSCISKNVNFNTKSLKLQTNYKVIKEKQQEKNKKKKNKKKKKEIKLEEIIEEDQNQKKAELERQKQQFYQNSTFFNSKSQKSKSDQKISQKSQQTSILNKSLDLHQLSKLQNANIAKPNSYIDKQLLKDFIYDQITLLKNYFLDDLQQINPYNRMRSSGRYNLTLMGTKKQLIIQWCYNESTYPQQIIELSFIYDNLNPLQQDKLNQIVTYQKKLFHEKKLYNYIFNVSTSIYQDLLMQLFELGQRQQQQQQISEYENILQKQKQKFNLNNKQQQWISSYNQNMNNNNIKDQQTSRMFRQQDKKQIYGKLLQQIFYMQDFKSQPNESMFIAKQSQNIQKKYHSRGRYINEFQQLQMIGQGGFGKVYKAKNKLDSNTYAIKKIVINYQNYSDRKLLKQVTLLSKLNHPNIVRYHQSWLQDANNLAQLINDMSITQIEQKQQLKLIYQGWKKSKRGVILFEDSSKSNNNNKKILEEENLIQFVQDNQDQIMFQQDDAIEFQDCSQIQFENSISDNQKNRKLSFGKIIDNYHQEDQQEDQQDGYDQQQQSSEESEQVKRKNKKLKKQKNKRKKQYSSHKQQQQNQYVQFSVQFPFKILYIVMQFCQGINLKQFISTRFNQQQHKIQIIRGILQGLAYIHERKIIHRDLKPANIFLTENNKVKIGDFGLATVGAYEQKSNLHQYQQKQYCQFQKTIGIGTAFYRAPQQIKSTKYDQKVDIYSLGIIMFEMFYQFSTYSERFKILSQINKANKLPRDFNLYGQITDYQISIQNCIKQSPQHRPTARKLLQNFRNKYFVLLVSAIANPKYAQFYQLIKHLFQISNQRRIQNIKKNYFKFYDIKQIFKIFSLHRGTNFPTFPLLFTTDYKTLNNFKIHTPAIRKQKYLVMSQNGVLLQYASNLYGPWIIYAKQTMRRKKYQIHHHLIQNIQEMRRYAFQKIIQVEYDSKKQQTFYKEKYVTGFDICYDMEEFQPFYTLQMFIISTSLINTLNLTQNNPTLYICHSKIFTILSKHYKIAPYKLYSCLLSTSQQKFTQMIQIKKLQYFQKFQIQGLPARKICQLFDQSFSQLEQFLKALQIFNLQQYTQYQQIYQQFNKILRLNDEFQLKNIQFKLMIPPNNCNGIYWNIGPIKGFTSVQEYNIGSLTGILCNLNLQLGLSQGEEVFDVSVWSNQEYMENQIMELVAKCWKMGVSVKYYKQAIGEKDESSKMNMIIRKKKGQRVYYNIRNNQTKNKQKSIHKFGYEETNKEQSVVLKEQFNHQIFKQINMTGNTAGSNNVFNWQKRKSDNGQG